jgi:starch synthase
LGTQGIFLHYDFSSTGLDWELFTPEYIESEGKLNLAKAGLIFADFISTVSQKYASEVLTSEFGFGLEEVLKKRRKDTFSILNGVDYQVWDPASDKYIAANFSPNNLRPKAQCREELARLFKLPLDDRPITAIISRLVDRKGLDIITAAMDRLATLDMKLVILGSGDDKYHIVLDGLAKAYPDRLGLKLTYERSLAHKVMAGADIFLMPSRYEPCGLEQLYGLKYGTVPVVRSTGGLEDTIIDFFQDPEAGTGFKFSDYSPDALFEVMRQVVALFKDQAAWKGLMLRGMDQDYSWAKATRKYEELYRRAIEKVGNSHVA